MLAQLVRFLCEANAEALPYSLKVGLVPALHGEGFGSSFKQQITQQPVD